MVIIDTDEKEHDKSNIFVIKHKTQIHIIKHYPKHQYVFVRTTGLIFSFKLYFFLCIWNNYSFKEIPIKYVCVCMYAT